MRKQVFLLAIALAAAATGCGGGQAGSGSSPSGEPRSGNVVNDGTATGIIPADPGNLDPQQTVLSVTRSVLAWAYDPLVNQAKNGDIVSGLADRWSQSANTFTFTLHPGVTCADGSTLTATTVANNLNYLGDPANKSPLLGLFFPPGLKATADDQAGTVTATLASPFPFFYTNLAQVGIVCQSGLDDRSTLAQQTAGTGAYALSQSVPGQSYTLTKRSDYSWGPRGASTVAGMPKQVVFKVVANETTGANLLLGGQANFGVVVGPDRKRLESAGLKSDETLAPLGQLWFNQAQGRPGADEQVRKALTMGLDLSQVGSVLAGGNGRTPTGLVTVEPKPCKGDTIGGNLPGHDVDAAKKLLDAAGWVAGSDGVRSKDGKPLAVDLLYTTDGAGAAGPAHELMAQQWQQLGVQVKQDGRSTTQLSDAIFTTGAWDVVDAPVTVQVPSQFVPFASPPAPPDGTDFAHIDNADYTRLAAEAAPQPGTDGCDSWNQAEAALFSAADTVPYVNSSAPLWVKSAQLDVVAGQVVPTSLRLLKG